MVALQEPDRSRCYFHLGYGTGEGIPAGDVARLEEAMDLLRSKYQETILKNLLDRCDQAFELTTANNSNTYLTTEEIAGDINRTIRRSNPQQSTQAWWQNYLMQTDLVAQELWVPNYRQPMNLRYRYERSGGEHINLLRGVADTAIGAAQFEHYRNAGSFGLPLF